MTNIQIINLISNFPVGNIPNNRQELLSKAEVVSYLARFQSEFSSIEDINERERIVNKFLSECLNAKEGLPTLIEAEHNLKLSPGFLCDYSKIEFIKENNPEFSQTYNIIANSLELEVNNTRSM